MTKCAFCREPTPIEEMVADHIVPLSQGGKSHDPANIQWVHRLCHNRQVKWYWRLWYRVLDWLDGWQPCPKEQQGYRCRHAILSNGKKECGDE